MKKWGIWIIMLLGAFLRFCLESQNMMFTADESYLAYIAQTIIKDFHIIWIGWSALGFDLYLGPFWIYIISPFLLISRGDPLILGYLSSFLGIVTIYLIYWFGKNAVNYKVGLIAALLYASLPLVILYDQKPYPPAIPLLSTLILISLYKTSKNKLWWIVFATTWGFVFHLHLSLILSLFVAIYWFLSQKFKHKIRIFSYSLIVFLATVSPLIMFDYFHTWSNVTAPIRAAKMIGQQESELFLSNHVNALFNSLGRVWYLTPGSQAGDEIVPNCKNAVASTTTESSLLMSVFGVCLYAWYMLSTTTWKQKSRRLVALLSLSFVLPFVFVPVINPIEYYLLGFFPLYFLMVGIIISNLKPKLQKLSYLIILVFIALGIGTIFRAKTDFGLAAKKNLVQKTMKEIGDETYYLSSEGGCQSVGGWRYLFTVYGKRPTSSKDDLSFGWLYEDELTGKKPKYKVLVIDTRSNYKVDANYKKEIKAGGFSAFVYDY